MYSKDGQQNSLKTPCERCKRNNRSCRIPESRPLGRKRGAQGRYRGIEKAVRNLQSEMKKAKMGNQAESLHEIVRLPVNQQSTSQPVPSRGSKEKTGYNVFSPPLEETYAISTPSNCRERNFELRGASVHEVLSSSVQLPRSDQESISNPLALLADASDAARLLECSSLPTHTSHALAEDLSPTQRPGDRVTGSLASRLLQRPGYVSLGLQLNRRCLEDGLDALILPVQREGQYPKYFKVPTYNHPCDVGPDLDPVDLGLVTMEEASYLFPV